MITAMTTALILLILLTTFTGLVRYARRDHFAGPASLSEAHDELGSLHTRHHLVPRH
jgi:hypothetical protein